jgi:hypothetical protein
MQGDSLASMSTLTPPRKRKRPDSFDVDEDATLIEEIEGAKIVRDPVYYKTSGDCKIRVDDTLFCVCSFSRLLYYVSDASSARSIVSYSNEIHPSFKPCFNFLRVALSLRASRTKIL